MLMKISPYVLFGFLLFCGNGFAPPSLVGQERFSRILLGEETDDYPSVGIVGSVRNGGFCTGTLISPTHVLTAAHCAEVIEGPTRGTFDLDGQIYETSDVVIHPDFNSFSFANDIAILVLSEPVLDVPPSQIFRDVPLVGDLLFIVGFGANGTADEGSDGTFGTKRVGITTIDEVTDDLVSWFFDDASESNTAAGDSGGPGYIDIDGDLFIACITSGGTEPDSVLGDFAFNTRVDAYADWIDQTVAAASDPPSSDQPSDPPADEPDGDGGFWSQPFPLLQLLIDFLTQLLEYLTEAIGDTPAAPTPPSETDTPVGTQPPATPPAGTQPVEGTDPVETPQETPTDSPEETPTETPVDCPVQNPGTEEPATEPTDPATEPTDPATEPTDPTTDPATEPPSDTPGGQPGGGQPGGTQPGGGVTLPGGTLPEDLTAPPASLPSGTAVEDSGASVLAAWNRYLRSLRTRLSDH